MLHSSAVVHVRPHRFPPALPTLCEPLQASTPASPITIGPDCGHAFAVFEALLAVFATPVGADFDAVVTTVRDCAINAVVCSTPSAGHSARRACCAMALR